MFRKIIKKIVEFFKSIFQKVKDFFQKKKTKINVDYDFIEYLNLTYNLLKQFHEIDGTSSIKASYSNENIKIEINIK